ncbi:MAG: WD40 repeat domain-containing protein [Bacteroidota bacterium]
MKKIEVKKVAQLTGHKGGIFTLTPSDEQYLFLSGAGDGWIVEWDLRHPKDGRLLARAEDTQINGKASIFALLKHNDLILAGNMNGGLHWIFPNDTSKNKNSLPHKKGVFDAQVIDNQLFTLGGQGVLTKWSLTNQLPTESIQLSGKSLRAIDFFPKRNELAIGASDGNIYILNATELSIKYTLQNAHDNSVFTLKYAPDGSQLWSGGRDAHLKVWDVENIFENIFSVPAHWYTVNSLVFSPDGKMVATGSRDKTIKIWDTKNFQLLKVLDTIKNGCHVNSVNTLLWSEYNHWLVSGSDDRSIIVWEILVN